MYTFFRLQTRQWSDRVIRREMRDWHVRGGLIKKQVQVVVTPRVREEVQKHYGCYNLTGAELEDQGEEGTVLTHWEKRLFEVRDVNSGEKKNQNGLCFHFSILE